MHVEKRRNASDLVLRTDVLENREAFAAFIALVAHLFDVALDAPGSGIVDGPVWVPFAYFDPAGRCVACIEATALDMRFDGADGQVTAIRLAGVDPAWRGRGLFRNLMDVSLAWSRETSAGPTLLYTEDHGLYEQFGFHPLPQHTFVGPAPEVMAGRPARVVDAKDPSDIALIAGLLGKRAPVSDRCAVLRAPSLFMANMTAEDLTLAYAADLDALIAYEFDGHEIALVDVVSAAIPSMARLLGTLPVHATRVRVLFPTERLGWDGAPEADETGLMARGALPPAMCRPFMLPPTTGF